MATASARVWPRRLLHLPSMTSLVRQEGHRYGEFIEPEYGALSYTWGRFAHPSSARLLVLHGVTWKIPAVRESHFTVQQFESALHKASCPNGMVWVDVA